MIFLLLSAPINNTLIERKANTRAFNMTTTEQRTMVLFLLHVAETINGLRREYAAMIRSKKGPLDNGYTAMIDPEDDYLIDSFNTFWLRQGIRAARLKASHMGG